MRHVGCLLDGNVGSRPAELVKDGDHILLIGWMLRLWGLDTVRITKGHAEKGMVREGGVRELDRLGSNAADEAADVGRRRVDFPVIDARRNFAGVCGRWYPVILVYGIAFLPLSPGLWLIMWKEPVLHLILWSGLLVLFRTGADSCMPFGIEPFWHEPAGIWDGEWIALAAAPITADDVGTWPCSVGIG